MLRSLGFESNSHSLSSHYSYSVSRRLSACQCELLANPLYKKYEVLISISSSARQYPVYFSVSIPPLSRSISTFAHATCSLSVFIVYLALEDWYSHIQTNYSSFYLKLFINIDTQDYHLILSFIPKQLYLIFYKSALFTE